MTETITGTNRSAGVSLSELLDADSHPVTDLLRNESRIGVREGNTRVPAWYYTSPEFHALEVEKLWSRVWQLACLEEEIPNVGDYHVYEIADMSFLIVRTADGIKAFRNACLHRGRRLREAHGEGAKNLRCAFHGWSWNLDGSLKEIPCEWDFPSVTAADYALPEALVDTWHGFVFVNPDRTAGPLAEHLAGLDEHFAAYPFERRVKVAHVEKIMRVNWKACQEAFMESYHVVATHPTLMDYLGDANTRYDTYTNFSRAISPQGIESPHLAGMTHYERLDDGKQYARYRHPMNGHIYERVELGRVRVIDLDGNESLLRRRRSSPRGPDHPGRPAPVQVDRRPDARGRARRSAEHAGATRRHGRPCRGAGVDRRAASGGDALACTATSSTPSSSATPSCSMRCTTRCSPTGHRGARSTRSSTGSVRTGTIPTSRSSK